MKNFKKILLVTLLALGCSLHAQDPVIQKKIDEIGKRFEQLPEQARIDFVKYKQKATEASRKQKFFSCMVAIDQALSIFKDDMDLIWLKGICRAQIHDVDAAIEQYKEVLAINPNHVPTLMNLVEINFFDGRYKEAVVYIEHMNKLLDSRANTRLPLLDFKYLISLTKLAKKDPAKYGAQKTKLLALYTYMDDHPYYYYANALKAFDEGDKQEGLIWILKAYLIFNSPPMIETWNKALVDTDYIGAHEIMFKRDAQK